MHELHRQASWAAAALALLGAPAPGLATEILKNGGLDESVGPVGWTSRETITDQPGAGVSLAEHISFANSPLDLGNPAGEPLLGVFVKPRSGNVDNFADQNLKINYVLEQVVSGQSGGVSYTLSGDARLSSGYSGAVEFLDPLSPSDPGFTGSVPSPTSTLFQLTFLDANSQPLGAPATKELRSPSLIVDDWQTHSLTATAPTGTNKIKVTISALNMVDNFGGQDLFLDNFKLVRGAQTIDRLSNGDLNTPGEPTAWTLTELPAGTDNSSFIGFAHHATPEKPSGQGLWVRAFAGGDMLLQQTQPAVAGGNYTFSAWSLFEQNYIGGVPGTATDTFLRLEFLDGASAVIGAPAELDIAASRLAQSGAAATANDMEWRQHVLNTVAPAGSANVRITVGATGLGFNVDPKQSAFFDDFSLQLAGPASDFDGDGKVDGKDLLAWQRGFGGAYDGGDLADWENNFGPAGAAASATPLPEPASLALLALAASWAGRRQRVRTPAARQAKP
jgi:hypothetical protein